MDETNQVIVGHSLNLGSVRAYARTEIHDLIYAHRWLRAYEIHDLGLL